MNAHQRRTERRKPVTLFDMESDFFVGGNFRPLLGDLFDFSSVRPSGERLSSTMRILKDRPALARGEFFFTAPGPFDIDFTKLEERIVAYGGCRSPGKSIDCHRAKAAELFNVAYEDVTPEQRAAGKNANYIDWYKA